MKWKTSCLAPIAVGPTVTYPPFPLRVVPESCTNQDRLAECICELCCNARRECLTTEAR
jgi:hypothetical protein